MKLTCAVVKDLLPLYAEKMVESETQLLVEEHLQECSECRQKLAEIETGTDAPIETAKPLKELKKEIRKRRWFTALIAALLVFVIVSVYFYHDGRMEQIPWQDGLVEVAGIEARPYAEVYRGHEPPDSSEAMVDVLVLKVDSRINGTYQSMFKDDDGTRTAILEGWSSKRHSDHPVKDYNEMALCPVPDRLLYSYGNQHKLLWGEPLQGGVEALPRLALAFYLWAAIVLTAVLGLLWFLLHKRNHSWIVRQLFFAPVSYIIAHFLIKGVHTESFFMERDFVSIVLIAMALYALLSLVWQIWLQQKRTNG